MKFVSFIRIIGISILLVSPWSVFSFSSLAHITPTLSRQSTQMMNGQILLAPMWDSTTYLIDNQGSVNHTWPSNYWPGVGVWWLSDGAILRTIRVVAVGPGGAGGSGGGVQKVQWDGTIVWDYRYCTDGHLSHHDVKTLPNGNVLLIAWETKTRAECIAAGRNPAYVSSSGLAPDHIIEVQPTGPTSGTIVWEWHVWDHLIQDYDPAKENYGVVGDHPELVDINYETSVKPDWMHTNAIDYNEEFNQILLTICYFNEIWVIDHSTTTEEARGHTGGNSGKGGDLLYRWGNPQTYRAGTSDDRKLFHQHDANWIDEGCPGEGNILIFNNGRQRPGTPYTTIDEIIPPVNDTGAYYLEPGSAFGPELPTWTYSADPTTSFYASYISGAQRLSSGNTLICNGEAGEIFEVTPEKTIVWQYTSPFPTPALNDVFKVIFIPPEEPEPDAPDLECSGSLSWTDVKPGTMVNGSFQLQNNGDPDSLLNWTINTSSISWGTWSYSPESGQHLTPEDGEITIQVSVVAPNENNSEFEGYLRVENMNDTTDFELIPVTLKTTLKIIPTWLASIRQLLSRFFEKHVFIQKLLHNFFSY